MTSRDSENETIKRVASDSVSELDRNLFDEMAHNHIDTGTEGENNLDDIQQYISKDVLDQLPQVVGMDLVEMALWAKDPESKGGLREKAMKWLDLMNEKNLEPDEVTMGIVVQMYKKGFPSTNNGFDQDLINGDHHREFLVIDDDHDTQLLDESDQVIAAVCV